MLIRTVLDCRPGDPKFFAAICLLVESWSNTMRGTIPLEICVLGPLPTRLRAFMEVRGATLRQVRPDPDLSFVPTGNTLLGAAPAANQCKVLLVDNDIVFLAALGDFAEAPEDLLAGAISGSDRISEANWGEIETILGLPTLPGGQILQKSRIAQLKDPTALRIRFPRGYINGGVLLLPKGSEFARTWKRHIIQIKEHFNGRTDQDTALCNSNMAGLATAAATHGGVHWLDDGLNYRHYHFLLNVRTVDRISILHMTGYPTKHWILGKPSSLSGYIEAYWRNRILGPLEELRTYISSDHYQSALETALAARGRLEAVARPKALDPEFSSILAELG